MKEETKQALKELKVILIIIVVFLIIAALIVSAYSKIGLNEALNLVAIQVLTAGTGGIFGNILYVAIVFLTLGVTFYMFEKIIILLSDIRLGGVLMKLSVKTIKDHYIVCGAGRVGTHAAEKLKASGKKVVIIENDCPKVEFLRKRGFLVVEGDCMNEEILEKAGIRKAKGILACTGEDNKNVFVVLTAKDLNPNIKIATRVNDLKAKGEFERAGADVIVAPEVTGGCELAKGIME
ncbi:MAG: NAD(P)-binding protein [Candidatus Aenigmatarchaeota archaeon]